MLIVVLAIAVLGIGLLAGAIITGSNSVALVVIALAAVGLVLLAREWLGDRSGHAGAPTKAADGDARDEAAAPQASHELAPDRFEPDIPYENEAQQPESEERADPTVDGNDSTGDIGAGPARQKH